MSRGRPGSPDSFGSGAPREEPPRNLSAGFQCEVHRSPRELEAAIEGFVEVSNDDPKPFVWTRTSDQILNGFLVLLCDIGSGPGLSHHGENLEEEAIKDKPAQCGDASPSRWGENPAPAGEGRWGPRGSRGDRWSRDRNSGGGSGRSGPP